MKYQKAPSSTTNKSPKHCQQAMQTPIKAKQNLHGKRDKKSPSPLLQKQGRVRSNTIKNEEVSQLISNQNLRANQNSKIPYNYSTRKLDISPSSYQQLSNMKPKQVKSLIQENEMLKNEIVLLQQLIQDVMPVLAKITEENRDNKESVNIQINSNINMNKQSTNTTKSAKFNEREVNFLQESLMQLKQAYETDQSQCNEDDSEFLEAEDLDITTSDERQSTPLRLLTSSKSSFLTFGMKEEVCNKNDNQRIMTPALQYNLTRKTKISDLNKQSKNFNMPINSDCKIKKQKLINYDGIQKLKGIIDQINDTDILKELRSRKELETKNQLQSRNQILGQNYSSNSFSGNSSISDDDNGSIPTESLITKNLIPEKRRMSNQIGQLNKLNQRFTMPKQQVKSSPFNQLNMISKKEQESKNQEEEKIHQDSMKKQIKNGEDDYQDVLINSSSINTQNSLISSSSINQSVSDIKQTLTNYKDSLVQQQVEEQVQNRQENQANEQNFKHQILDTMDQNNERSRQTQVAAYPLQSKNQLTSSSDNEKYAHQIREVNFDNQQDVSHVDDNLVVDYYFQSQSRDCFMLSSSEIMTDQIVTNSKRGSVDPFIQMLENESPCQDQKEPIRGDSLTEEGNLTEKQETPIKSSQKSKQKQSQSRQMSERKLSSLAKQDKENNMKTPQLQNIQENNLLNFNKIDDSLPSLRMLCVKQQEKPHLIDASIRSSLLQPIQNSNVLNSFRTSLSPQRIENQNLIVAQKRGKSLSHYQSNHSRTQSQEFDFENQQQQQSKWISQEEKERSLATLNKEVLARSRANSQVKNVNQETLALVSIPPISIKLSDKIEQKDQIALENSHCEPSVVGNSTNQVCFLSQRTDTQKQQDCFQTQLVIDNFSIKPVEIQSSNNKNEDTLTLKTNIFEQDQDSNEPDQKDQYSKFVEEFTLANIEQGVQQREKFIQGYVKHQKTIELEQLSTPSPRQLDDKLIQHQLSFQNFQLCCHFQESKQESKLFTFQDQESQFKNEDTLSKDQQVNELVNVTNLFKDINSSDSDTQKSSKLDQLTNDYFNNEGFFPQNSQSKRQSIDNKIQVNSHSSSQELIEVSVAYPLKLGKNEKTLNNLEICNDYRQKNAQDSQNQVLEETQHEGTIVYDIQISPTKETKSMKYECEEKAQNNTIKEEPTIEEQESNLITNQQQTEIKNGDIRIVDLQSEQSSKISITQIEMAESEMFSQFNSEVPSMPRSSILQTKQVNQVKQQNPSSYSTNRYESPLKSYVNSVVSSAKLTPKISRTITQKDSIVHSKDDKAKDTQCESTSKELSVENRSKDDLKQTPIKCIKSSNNNSAMNQKTPRQLKVLTDRSSQAKVRINQSMKEKNLSGKQDIKLDKIDNLHEQITERQKQPVSAKNALVTKQNRRTQSINNHPQKTQNCDAQAIANNAVLKKTMIMTHRQTQLEQKLKEKEERIKTILQIKKDREEQRNQLRQSKERESSKQRNLNSARSTQKFSLTKGSFILKSLSNSNSKVLLKKDINSNKFLNKQSSTKLIKEVIDQEKSKQYIEVLSREKNGHQQKNFNLQDIKDSLIETHQQIELQTQRFDSLCMKDTMNNQPMNIQLTSRHQEFFKRIESDCQQRKNMQQNVRKQNMKLIRLKKQINP